MTGKGHGGPRRGYSWPPFQPGNDVAVKHGADSPRLVGADAQRLLDELRAEGVSWLAEVDGAALQAWLHAEAACRRLRAYVDEHGLIDGNGKPRRAAGLLLQFERRAHSARQALGFDPSSRAALGRDTAIARATAQAGIDEAKAEGRRLRLAAEQRHGLDPAERDGDDSDGGGDAA